MAGQSWRNQWVYPMLTLGALAAGGTFALFAIDHYLDTAGFADPITHYLSFNGDAVANSIGVLSSIVGQVLGIIGRNGAGKSTLLKILTRIVAPTAGRAEIRGRVGSLLEVGTGFNQELTGRENVYLNGAILGMKRREIEARFDDIVEFSGVETFIDTPVKRYSSGMYVRLAFAVAAHLEPEILFVDEVLSVGDAEFQRRCLGRMEELANTGRTVVFVEVKTRLSDDGSALEAVDARKQARLLRGAAAWLREQRPHARRVRFDVIACEWRAGSGWRVSHLEGAFDAGD